MTVDVLNRSPPNGVKVLIVGAGIGGLMTALECWRRGFEVRIVERQNVAATTGDAIAIGPSGLTAAQHYPDMRPEQLALEPLVKFSDGIGRSRMEPFDPKRLLSKEAVASGKVILRYSRPNFYDMLAEQVDRVGLKIDFGYKAEEYWEQEDGTPGVTFANGEKATADLVIAADGLRSASWPLVAGEPVPARSSGDAIYRMAYPADLVDDEIKERFPLKDGRSVFDMWLGSTYTFGVWRDETKLTWLMSRPDPGTAQESWGHRVDPEEALKFTANIPDWPEVANKVIRSTPKDALVDWKLMWRDPQPNWVSPKGRVLQLGDAAHSFLPQSGNGGTQALEDAISIAACLSSALADTKSSSTGDSIANATRVHNLLRFERVSCLQAFGVQNKKAYRSGPKKDGSDPVHVGQWILKHDPEEYALENFHAALAHLNDKENVSFKNTNIPEGLVYRPWTIEGLLDAQERGEPTILDGDWK